MLKGLGFLQASMPSIVPKGAEQVVKPKPQPNLPKTIAVGFVDREDEGEGPDQVGVEAALYGALTERLEDQAELQVLKVAEPSVDKLRGATRRAEGVISALDQRDLQPAHCSVSGDTGTRDTSPNDKEVEGLRHHARQSVITPLLRFWSFGAMGGYGGVHLHDWQPTDADALRQRTNQSLADSEYRALYVRLKGPGIHDASRGL